MKRAAQEKFVLKRKAQPHRAKAKCGDAKCCICHSEKVLGVKPAKLAQADRAFREQLECIVERMKCEECLKPISGEPVVLQPSLSWYWDEHGQHEEVTTRTVCKKCAKLIQPKEKR